jgi:DNA-binding transcriptional LysR family regulator
MGDFKREHPRPTLSLKISDTKEIIQDLLQGHIEFGIIGGKVNHSSLHYETFDKDEIIVIAPSDHPLTRRKSVGFEDLLGEPWIIREEGSGTQMAVERALRKKGKSLKDFNVAIEMGSTSSVKEGVKAKLGFAFISRRAVEEELNRHLFTSIPLEGFESISRQIYIVFLRGKTVSPLGTEFLRFLRKKRERTN